MSQTIVRRFVCTTATTISDAGGVIAKTIGANFNDVDNIIYMGEDSTTGIKLIASGTSNFNLQLCNGTNTINIYSGSNNAPSITNFTMRYVKTDNVILFSFSENSYNKLTNGFVKGRNLETDEVNWMTFGSTNSNQSDVRITSENATSLINISGKTITESSDIIVMTPIAFDTGSEMVTTDYLFTASVCKTAIENVAFSLDGHEYLILSISSSLSYTKPIVKLT